MGWTGYFDMTAAQAIDYELQGWDLLAKSGRWRLIEKDGKVLFCECLTERHGNETCVKIVTADMGPLGTPPKGIFDKYLAAKPETDSEWEDKFRERCANELANPPEALTAGDKFTVTGGSYNPNWSDGQPITGTYTFLGKFRAKRYDGRIVCLPRAWRKRYDWQKIAA